MLGYTVSEIHPRDRYALEQMDRLLKKEGIRRDNNLDHSIGVYTDGMELVATGSTFTNTLRCLAVDSAHRGEGLMNIVVSRLMDWQAARGYSHLFLYTKWENRSIFADLGFTEVASVPGHIAFMENMPNGFARYVGSLQRGTGKQAAVVMNANPFTLGHRYLVRTAAAMCDILHLFIVSEDVSLFPFDVRFHLVKEGTADVDNILFHRTDDYMISSATFPSYFMPSDASAIRGQAELDAAVFVKIARALGITARYVGEEPFSRTTRLYNEALQSTLPAAGVDLNVIPRLSAEDEAVSASKVRSLIQAGKLEHVQALVPASTWNYLISAAAAPVIKAICDADHVIHD